MYKCQKCKKLSAPREGANKIVVETRPKIYYNRDNKEVARGSEIVKEVTICTGCVGKQ